MHWPQELANNVQGGGGSGVLQRRREPRGRGAQWLALGSWQQTTESITEADPHNYTRSCQRTPQGPFCDHTAFEANWSGESAPSAGLARRPKSQNAVIVKCCLLLLHAATVNHVSTGLTVTCNEKYVLFGNRRQPAQCLDQEAPKHFPKPNLHQKMSRSLFGGLLTVWSTIAFWILAKHYMWEVCSADWWDASKTATPAARATERTQFFSMTTPNHTLYNQGFRSWMNWATMFCFIRHIHLTSRQPTTTSSIILTTFCRENVSTTSRTQKKMLSKSL